MSARSALFTVALGLAVLPGSPAQGKPTRTDAYGDPLPVGALARIGTVRLTHSDSIQCVAFTPDGKGVVSCDGWGGLFLWDAKTGKRLRSFTGDRFSLTRAAVSPNGQLLVSVGGRSDAIRVREVSTGRLLRIIGEGGEGGSIALAFSPDGRTVARGGYDLSLWDVSTGKRVWEFGELGEKKSVCCVAFRPDGKTLATGHGDGMIRFWDVAGRREIGAAGGHKGNVWGLSFSPGGKYLVSAGEDDHRLILRDAKSGKEVRRLFKARGFSCSRLAFSPDGRAVALVPGGEENIRLFDTETGKEVRKFVGHRHWVYDFAFSPDGKTLASASADNTVRLWDVATGKQRLPRPPQVRVRSLAFSADGTRLFSTDRSPTVHVWDAATGKEVRRLTGPVRQWDYLRLAPDGRALFAWTYDSAFCRWDLASGKEVESWSFPKDWCLPGSCTFADLSPDGTTAVALRFEKPGELYEGKSRKSVGKVPDAFGALYLPDGKSLVLWTQSGPHLWAGSFLLWDLATGREVLRFQGERVSHRGMAVSPDGETFVAGDQDGVLRRWEVRTGRYLSSVQIKEGWLDPIALSPDGRTLAVGDPRYRVLLLEAATGGRRAELAGHRGQIDALAFSPDGRRLASGSDDLTALVWDLTAGTASAAPKSLTPDRLKELWQDLGGKDAARAYRSLWVLVASPRSAVPFLRAHLKPPAPADPRRLARLLADLDSPDFDARQKAQAELEGWGELAEDALQKAAIKPTSLEVARRLKAVQARLAAERAAPTGYSLRRLRTVEVLEYIGTAPAREALQSLAKGAPTARLTREAKASLARLARRTTTTRRPSPAVGN